MSNGNNHNQAGRKRNPSGETVTVRKRDVASNSGRRGSGGPKKTTK